MVGVRKLIASILLAVFFIAGCAPLVLAATDALYEQIEQVRKYRAEKGREIESIQREIANLQKEIDPKVYNELRAQLDEVKSDNKFEQAVKILLSLGHVFTAEDQIIKALQEYGDKYRTYPELIAAKEGEIQSIQAHIDQYSKQQGDSIYRTVWSDYVNAKNAMNAADQAYNQAKGTPLEWSKQKEANEATQRFNLAEDNFNKIKGYYKEWTGQDPPALSENPATGGGQVVQPGQPSIPGQASSTYLQDVDKDTRANASFLETAFGKLFSGIPQALAAILGLADPMQLVFFNAFPGTNQQGGGDLWLNIFTPTEKSVVGSVYGAFEGLMPTLFVIAVVVAGSIILIGTIGSEKRLEAKQYIQGVLVAVLLLKFGPVIMSLVADINQFFVHFMASMMTAQGIDLTQGFISQFFPDGSVSIAAIILGLLGILMIGLLNFHYVVRKVCLAVLIMLLPVTAFMSIFKKGLIDLWIKEFASNVFLQLGHAVTIAFFFMAFGQGENFFVLIVMLMSLGGIADLVRKLFGVGDGGHGAMALAAGLVGAEHLMGIGRVIGRTISGQKPSSSNRVDSGSGESSGDALGGGSDLATFAPKPRSGRSGSSITSKVLRGGAAIGGSVAGAMIGGAIGGKAGLSAGAGLGASAGASGMSVVTDTAGRIGINFSAAQHRHDEEGIEFGKAFAEEIGFYHGGQLAVPGEAAKIGRQLLGGEGLAGFAGSVAGGVVGGVGWAYNHQYAPRAREVKADIKSQYQKARRDFNNILENVYTGREDKTPLSYQQHQAQFAAAKMQYGPGSTAWLNMKSQAATAKTAYEDFRLNKNEYISHYATPEQGEAAYAKEEERLLQEYRSSEQAAMYGPAQWREALAEHETIEASVRRHHIQAMQAEARMSKQGQELAVAFAQLNQHRAPVAGGTVNDTMG